MLTHRRNLWLRCGSLSPLARVLARPVHHCSAQAEDVLRLLRENADDIHLVMRLNAQYGSMVRTSLSVHDA
jgi:hypothetical protein